MSYPGDQKCSDRNTLEYLRSFPKVRFVAGAKGQHLLPFPVAANLCQQAVFLHNTQDGFGVVVNPFAAFQPLPHPSVAIGMKAFVLLLPDGFSKGSILFRPVHSLDKAVITASGH